MFCCFEQIVLPSLAFRDSFRLTPTNVQKFDFYPNKCPSEPFTPTNVQVSWHTNPRGANKPRPTDRETTHARGARRVPDSPGLTLLRSNSEIPHTLSRRAPLIGATRTIECPRARRSVRSRSFNHRSRRASDERPATTSHSRLNRPPRAPRHEFADVERARWRACSAS